MDDEVVTNSLSALEAGRIDEIVSKTSAAREGGFGGALRAQTPLGGLEANAGKKNSSNLEEQIVRSRTRFSIFEAWYELLGEMDAVGRFDGWSSNCVNDVSVGDTVEVRGDLTLAPLQTVLRLFFWFMEQAADPETRLTSDEIIEADDDGDDSTEYGLRSVRKMLGIDDDEIPVIALPGNASEPPVLLTLKSAWMIGRLGDLGGEFTIVGQVIQKVGDGEEYPVLRLTRDVTPTPLEIDTLRGVVQGFVEPASALGVVVDPDESVAKGPALVMTPIAIFR